MKHKVKNIKVPAIILSIVTGIAPAVFAEGFNMDSVNEGLTAVQKTAGTTQAATQGAAVADQVAAGSLTDSLVKQLGISTEQAQGGAGALFSAAKGNLNAEQFADLSKSVPEMDTLLSAAPKQSSSLTDLTGGVSSALGDKDNAFGNLAGLASSFEQLNLSPDMVDQFVPVVVDYVRTNGGSMTADMLQSALFGM